MNSLRRKLARELAKTAKQSLLIGGAAFVAADLARRAFRHLQLFCPERKAVKSWNPEDYGVPRERVEEQWFETPDGEMLYGWYCRAEKPIPEKKRFTAAQLLKRLLERIPVPATYLIRRDVVEITTAAFAKNDKEIRVYPVADLVIPIPSSVNPQSLQQQVSGVSLDEEATRLVQLQSSYDAASKIVTVIDDTLQNLLNMIPT